MGLSLGLRQLEIWEKEDPHPHTPKPHTDTGWKESCGYLICETLLCNEPFLFLS